MTCSRGKQGKQRGDAAPFPPDPFALPFDTDCTWADELVEQLVLLVLVGAVVIYLAEALKTNGPAALAPPAQSSRWRGLAARRKRPEAKPGCHYAQQHISVARAPRRSMTNCAARRVRRGVKTGPDGNPRSFTSAAAFRSAMAPRFMPRCALAASGCRPWTGVQYPPAHEFSPESDTSECDCV